MRSHRGVGFVICLALLSAGCAGPAALDFPEGESDKLVSGALSQLAGHPFLSFTGTVDDFTGGDSATIDVGVTGSGLMYGTAEVSGKKLKLVSIDGKYLVNAETGFWKGRDDYDAAAARKLGGDWTPVDPKKWFHPGSSLATEEFTSALTATLEDVKAADSWRPEPTEKYGAACHPFRVRDGTLCVSSRKPHRITYFDDVPVTFGSTSATLDLEFGGIDAAAVKSWAKKLRAAVEDLSPVYAYGGVSMTTSSDNFVCFATT